MASAVLFDIAQEILNRLGSLALHEIGQWWGLQTELQKLQIMVSTIQAVLLDAEKQYSQNYQVKVWLEQLREAVYDADDLLDDISTEALRQEVMSGNRLTKKVCLFFSRANKLAYGLKMADQAKAMNERLGLVAATRNFHLHEQHIESTLMGSDREQSHSSLPEIVFGREKDKKKVLDLLLSDSDEANAVVIAIVGIGGLGKTTLAQLVYNDKIVETHFGIKSWVCVSDAFDVKVIVEKILECGTGKDAGLDMEMLKAQLHNKIDGRKYLLVLDDVWNEDREKWLHLKDLARGVARGSRILITTRLKRVAEITSQISPYELKSLSEDESWDLFQKMAFKQGKVPNKSFEVMGRQIVAKCSGVPLAIRTIGSLLYNTEEELVWQSFKDDELSSLTQSDILKTLKLSYNHLPSNLKHCFAYCSLFPKGYKFHVPTLIYLWKGQGYIKPSNQSRYIIDLGYSCFASLVQRSFFQEVEKDEFGTIKYCRMHDLMHDLAVSVAGNESAILSNPNATCLDEKTRHLSLVLPWDSELQIPPSLFKARKARTFLLPHGACGEMDEERCQAIITNLRCLRVLDLHLSNITKLPHSVHKLKHLRYLDLSSNVDIKKLPSSISRLQNLQRLHLDFCSSLRCLPKDTKKLVNLEHLGIAGCHKLTHMPLGIGRLSSLEVLSRFVVPKDKRCSIKHSAGGIKELHGLNSLTGRLEIVNLRYLKDAASECKAADMKEKARLQALHLDWSRDGDDGVGNNDEEEMALEALEPHKNLSDYSVNGYEGIKFPSWLSSLTNLVRIEISLCRKCKSIPPLHKLPLLHTLRLCQLNDLEYIDIEGEGGGSSTMSLFFPSLKELYLNRCPNLRGWWRGDETDVGLKSSLVREGRAPQFSSLCNLEISSCPMLTSMPVLLPFLEDLYLEDSSTKFLDQILKQTALVAQPSSSPPTSSSCSSTSCIPSPLRSLYIEKIRDLELLPEDLVKNLTRLKTLVVRDCRALRVLSPSTLHLTFLEELTIDSCGELCSMEGEDEDISGDLWQTIRNLRSLKIEECPKVKSLPKGLQHVSSLQSLKIERCHGSMFLPEWMVGLTSLQHLHIKNCPQLAERCRNNEGEDWHKIAHISNITIDGNVIQEAGHRKL